MQLLHYFVRLNTSRLVLWCYFLWWQLAVVHHFDARLRLWFTSLGLSAIIGTALVLSTRTQGEKAARLDGWVVFRLFLMPFCVSSFAALVKDAGFVLVFPPTVQENASALGVIAAFLIVQRVLKTALKTR